MDLRKPNHFDDWGVVHHTDDIEQTLYTSACGKCTNAPDDTVETERPVTCLFCAAIRP